jgi:16S rRNA processing protein RimM
VQLTVATIARPHGLRGEVALTVRTDEPGERLAAGTVLATAPAHAGPLTVVGSRVSGDRWYARFAEVDSREAAEGLRGVDLLVESGDSSEDDAWYPHELVGLRVELPDGTVVGEVVGLEHLPAQDVLVVREPDGRRSMVPFVSAIVPEVDVVGGRVVLDPPRGLLAADAEAADEPARRGAPGSEGA